MFKTNNFSGSIDIQQYVHDIGAEHCPFLKMSTDQHLTEFTEYNLDGQSFDYLQKFMFYSGYVHVTLFRKKRVLEIITKNKLLISENIIYRTRTEYNGKKLFEYPHWFLKMLFTPKSILLGKFWKGEVAKSNMGKSIPIPPFHLLSIRSAIKPKDRRFFGLTPELEGCYIDSIDENEFLIPDYISGASTKQVIQDVYDLDSENCTKEQVILVVNKMMQSSFYNDTAKFISSLETNLGMASFSQSQIIKDRYVD